jgi:hypothetical protein
MDVQSVFLGSKSQGRLNLSCSAMLYDIKIIPKDWPYSLPRSTRKKLSDMLIKIQLFL